MGEDGGGRQDDNPDLSKAHCGRELGLPNQVAGSLKEF